MQTDMWFHDRSGHWRPRREHHRLIGGGHLSSGICSASRPFHRSHLGQSLTRSLHKSGSCPGLSSIQNRTRRPYQCRQANIVQDECPSGIHLTLFVCENTNRCKHKSYSVRNWIKVDVIAKQSLHKYHTHGSVNSGSRKNRCHT